MTRDQTGRTGEAVAAKYYLDRGCRLLAHNYRTRMGELDLVLQEGNTVVICEVKTRSGRVRGTPGEAVNAAKQRRLILAARRYLQETGRTEDFVRFDVAEVLRTSHGWQVHCIRNAFVCHS